MDEKALEKEVQIIDKQVNSLVISGETYELAGEMVLGMDKLIKKINDFFDEPIKLAHATHKNLTTKRSNLIKPIEDRKSMLKKKISVYLTEQERKRKEAQAKLDEERRQKEEAQRQKIIAQAEKAEAEGKTEKADKLMDKAAEVYIPQTIVESEIDTNIQSESGSVSAKNDIEIEVVDSYAFLSAVANKTLPISLVEIKENKIKQFIKLQGLQQIPGVHIREVVVAATRRK